MEKIYNNYYTTTGYIEKKLPSGLIYYKPKVQLVKELNIEETINNIIESMNESIKR